MHMHMCMCMCMHMHMHMHMRMHMHMHMHMHVHVRRARAQCMHTAHALHMHAPHCLHAALCCAPLRCAVQAEPQVALLRGAAAMARVQPLTPLTLHEVVLVGTQARTKGVGMHAARDRCVARAAATSLLP